jgi:hypothetical protein
MAIAGIGIEKTKVLKDWFDSAQRERSERPPPRRLDRHQDSRLDPTQVAPRPAARNGPARVHEGYQRVRARMRRRHRNGPARRALPPMLRGPAVPLHARAIRDAYQSPTGEVVVLEQGDFYDRRGVVMDPRRVVHALAGVHIGARLFRGGWSGMTGSTESPPTPRGPTSACPGRAGPRTASPHQMARAFHLVEIGVSSSPNAKLLISSSPLNERRSPPLRSIRLPAGKGVRLRHG